MMTTNRAVETATYSAEIRRTTSNVPPHSRRHPCPRPASATATPSPRITSAHSPTRSCRLNSEAARWFGPGWEGQGRRLQGHRPAGRGTRAVRRPGRPGPRRHPGLRRRLQHLPRGGSERTRVAGYCQGADWIRPIDEYDLAAYYKALTLRASLDPVTGFVFGAAPPDPRRRRRRRRNRPPRLLRRDPGARIACLERLGDRPGQDPRRHDDARRQPPLPLAGGAAVLRGPSHGAG